VATPACRAEAVRRRTCRAEAVRRRAPSAAQGRRNRFREPNVCQPCGLWRARQRLACGVFSAALVRSPSCNAVASCIYHVRLAGTGRASRIPQHSCSALLSPLSRQRFLVSGFTFQRSYAPTLLRSYASTRIFLTWKSDQVRPLKFMNATQNRKITRSPGYSKGRGQLVPASDGWHSGGTGFQPVVSGVPPETRPISCIPHRIPGASAFALYSALRTPNSALEGLGIPASRIAPLEVRPSQTKSDLSNL